MKNTIKLIGVAVLVAVIGFTMIACGGGGSSDPSDKPSTGGGATYGVTWDPNGDWMNNVSDPCFSIIWGDIEPSEQNTIEKAMKTSDIVLTPNDVIQMKGQVIEGGTNMGVIIPCTMLKAGTVKITLKTIAGYSFTKASWGEDTITVE